MFCFFFIYNHLIYPLVVYLVYHSVSAFFIKADCLFIRTESYILESHHFCAYVKFRYRPEFIFIFSPRNTIRKIKMIEIVVFTASKHICQKYFNRQKPVSLKSLVSSAVHRISHIFQDFQIIGMLFLLRSPAHFSSEYFFRIFSLSILIPRIPRPHPKSVPLQIPPPQDTLRLLPHLRAFLCGRERFLLQIPISRHWSGENLFRFL